MTTPMDPIQSSAEPMSIDAEGNLKLSLAAPPSAKADGSLPKPPRLDDEVLELQLKEEPEYVAESKSSGQPMLVFKAEAIGPKTIYVDGKPYDPSGIEFSMYCTLQAGKTAQLRNLHLACELPIDISISARDGKPIGIKYAGKRFYALCGTEIQTKQKEGANGEKVDIINPLTGKPITNDNYRIKRILTKDN
jgi:hypothetical protein